MSFTLTDNDGNITKEIWSCTECMWLSTKSHCPSEDGQIVCGLCRSPCEQTNTVTESTTMPEFKYRDLLSVVKESASGVGGSTIGAIDEHFENGDEFVDSVKECYQSGNYGSLTQISGVGEATAENIALALAEEEDWEGGVAESSFALSA